MADGQTLQNRLQSIYEALGGKAITPPDGVDKLEWWFQQFHEFLTGEAGVKPPNPCPGLDPLDWWLNLLLNDLGSPLPGGGGVLIYGSVKDFPAQGAENCLYVAIAEKQEFVWRDGQYKKVGEADVMQGSWLGRDFNTFAGLTAFNTNRPVFCPR